MATLALFGVASVFLGKAAAGGSALASIGIALAASVGSAIDNTLIFPALFAEDTQAGSLGSLQVNPSDEGSAVYYAIGERCRVPGQVVYAGTPQVVTVTSGGGKRGRTETKTWYRDMQYAFVWNNIQAFEQFDMNGEAVWQQLRTRTIRFDWDQGAAEGKHSLGFVGESTEYVGGFSFESVQEWQLAQPLVGGGVPAGILYAYYLKTWHITLRNEEGFIPDELSQFVEGEDVTLVNWNPTLGETFRMDLPCVSSGQVGQHPNGDPIYEVVLDLWRYWSPNQLARSAQPTDPLVHWAGPINWVPFPASGPLPPPPAAPRVLTANYPVGGWWGGLAGAYVEISQTTGEDWREHLLRGGGGGTLYLGVPNADQTSSMLEAATEVGDIAGNVGRALLDLPQMNQSMFGGVAPNVQAYLDARQQDFVAGQPRDTTIAEGMSWMLEEHCGIPHSYHDTGFVGAAQASPGDPYSTRLTGKMRGLVVASLQGMASHIAHYLVAFDLFMTEHSAKVYVDAHASRPAYTLPWSSLDARRIGAPPSRALDERDTDNVSRPQKLDIQFLNFDRDNQQGNKHSRFDGFGEIYEIDKAAAQISTGNITLSEFEGQEIVDRLHRRQFGPQRAATVRVSQQDLDITPGDVLIMTSDQTKGAYAGKTLYFMVDESVLSDDLLLSCAGFISETPPEGWTPPT